MASGRRGLICQRGKASGLRSGCFGKTTRGPARSTSWRWSVTCPATATAPPTGARSAMSRVQGERHHRPRLDHGFPHLHRRMVAGPHPLVRGWSGLLRIGPHPGHPRQPLALRRRLPHAAQRGRRWHMAGIARRHHGVSAGDAGRLGTRLRARAGAPAGHPGRLVPGVPRYRGPGLCHRLLRRLGRQSTRAAESGQRDLVHDIRSAPRHPRIQVHDQRVGRQPEWFTPGDEGTLTSYGDNDTYVNRYVDVRWQGLQTDADCFSSPEGCPGSGGAGCTDPDASNYSIAVNRRWQLRI